MCNTNKKKKQQIKINKQNKSKANRKLNQLHHSSVKENIQIEGITSKKETILNDNHHWMHSMWNVSVYLIFVCLVLCILLFPL
jgi:hypothetical protein